jgi:hypothetical protein
LLQCALRNVAECAAAVVQVLIDDNNIDIDTDQVKMVKDMISSYHPSKGAVMTGRSGIRNRDFLYEIVANKRNGIDVDKVRAFVVGVDVDWAP